MQSHNVFNGPKKRAHRADETYTNAVWTWDIPAVPTESSVSMLKNQQSANATAWRDVLDTHTRNMGDATQTEAGRLVRSAKFAQTMLDSRRAAIESARDQARSQLTDLHRTLERKANPPSDPGEAALFADMRSYLRTLPIEERVAVLAKAAEGNASESRLLHAAVAGPPEAGLLPPKFYEQFRGTYFTNVAMNEYGHKLRLSEALETAERGFREFEAHVTDLVDFKSADAFSRNAA